MIRAVAIAWLAACSSGASSNPGHQNPSPNSSDPQQKNPKGTGTLILELHGFRNNVGQALAGLYVGPRGFPEDRKAAIEGKAAPIRDRRATFRFERVPATRIAIAALHDENGDGRMERGFFGQPEEGYGFSRDAPVRFGPPDFDDAAIDLAAGEQKTIRIRIRY